MIMFVGKSVLQNLKFKENRYRNQMNYQNLDRDYLIKQNRKLRMELKQSNNIKELHQQALIEMNQRYPQSQVIQTLISIINQTSNRTKINELNETIMQLEGKVMVLEKIASQTQENEKQTYNLLADEFQKLKEENAKVSDQLHKFYQKIGEVDYISGLVTKYREIITATEQAMAFKKEQEQLLDALNLQQETIKKISQEKDKLMRINVHMKGEVEKKKDEVRNMTMMLFAGDDNQELVNTENLLDELNGDTDPNGGSNEHVDQLYVPTSERSNISMGKMSKANISRMNASLMGSNPNTTLNFIKMQRELLKDVREEDEMSSSFTNESDIDCPELSILFPDKVQKIIRSKEQSKVPYLNMKKVREMMAKREEKMRKEWEQEKHHVNPTNKIIQLETELEITRKELSNQTLKFRLMTDEVKALKLKIEEMEKRNELLVESNLKLKNNYQIIFKDYQACKSLSTEVERVMGLVEGRDNHQKIKERLGILLSTNQQAGESHELESTFRDQLSSKRLCQIFSYKNASTLHKRNHTL